MIKISEEGLSGKNYREMMFSSNSIDFEFSQDLVSRIYRTRDIIEDLISKKRVVYGVNTGFGVNGNRMIPSEKLGELQSNLVSYLLCGSGELLPLEVSRGILLARLVSLSKGYSGVSMEMLEKMKTLYMEDCLPVVPSRGSLGASGDLIPLAYLADNLRGNGFVWWKGERVTAMEVFKSKNIEPYSLKTKEALALLNGTSAMVSVANYLLQHASFLLDFSVKSTALLTLVLKGRTEAFSHFVNSQAKSHPGQAKASDEIRRLLDSEEYENLSYLSSFESKDLSHPIQDRYSLRCAPQVLGPFVELLWKCDEWFESELNSASDNPLIDEEGRLFHGGNFYGGYLAQGIDNIKLFIAHLADLMDRQMMLIFDPAVTQHLPKNLSIGDSASHGLKGLHQSMSAIASEVISMSNPVSIYSRSSESHNQDKVSLGMSCGTSAMRMLDPIYEMCSLYSIVLGQGLDLMKIKLKSNDLNEFHERTRKWVPFVDRDQRLDQSIEKLGADLKLKAETRGQDWVCWN